MSPKNTKQRTTTNSEQQTATAERRVDELIDKLALGKAADTIIGDAKRRGISGGERKRLAAERKKKERAEREGAIAPR